jgi:hypothetical protein
LKKIIGKALFRWEKPSFSLHNGSQGPFSAKRLITKMQNFLKMAQI